MDIYNRIIALVKEKGVTKKKFLEDLSIAQSAIIYWKKGSLPNTPTLIKIADYFNVSIDYLTGRIDNPKPQITYQSLPCEAMELISIIEAMSPQREQAEIIREYLLALQNFDL